MSNNKPLKNSSKLLVNLDKFIFLVNAADSLEEIEIIRDLCCDPRQYRGQPAPLNF